MKKIVAVILMIMMACSVIGCKKENTSNDIDWPVNGIGALLPKPDAESISIDYEDEECFSAYINDATIDDFNSYVKKCKDSGFTVESESGSEDYYAYNNDGYELEISYYEDDSEIYIDIEEPKANGTLYWPSIGLATLIPQPNSTVGNITSDSEDYFHAYIGEMSFDDYKAYVNNCIESGFNIDYSNDEEDFSAENKDGVSIWLEYEGFNTMYVSLELPEMDEEEEDVTIIADTTEAVAEETTSIQIEETTASKTQENSVNGMRPEFKAAMDSYEKFFDEYCDFMKKYSENPSDLTLLTEYADFMSQYSDTMSKMEELQNDDLNDAELKYYTDVTTRITQKLMEVSTSIE